MNWTAALRGFLVSLVVLACLAGFMVLVNFLGETYGVPGALLGMSVGVAAVVGIAYGLEKRP